ncbi:uncharacterized protein LOC126372009 [Pectinophora gossypiella]|uniref:uncharacterized protein LOC126372009 n=1 Tax=Pectinophora gossypiella TaxID=13191 RepID=UPI00214F20A1|nr:uncharacterized protein LOC126372009 [Pectinophora gossypiella]
MSFLGPKSMHREKSPHPWEKSIKDKYSDRFKYAHNSVNNPTYPKKKKLPKNRITFTVIGNRVTKEFIYCVNIVKGMHKYRSKIFAPPVIKEVTGVEWPGVWQDLKIKYGGTAYCIPKQVAILYNDEFFGGDQELKEFMESRYIYHLCLNYAKLAVEAFSGFVRSSGLYSDLVPYTCENFLRLCSTTRGGYGGTPIHRIVKNGWIQCGGYTLKSTDLGCENFIVPHDRRGVLAMCNDGRHVDCSTQFFILLQPADWMANKYVAFGQLVDGDKVLQQIEQVPTMYESPIEPITIYKAGVLNMDCQNIRINKNIQNYLYKHIEDLVAVGRLFYEELLERVWAAVAARCILREVEIVTSDLEMTDSDSGTMSPEKISKTSKQDQPPDIEDVFKRYEPEEEPAPILPQTAPLLPEVEKPYYLPFTDVPYPDETDSTYDLKRFLQGHYCLFCDLEVNLPKNEKLKKKLFLQYSNIPSDMFVFDDNKTKIDSGKTFNHIIRTCTPAKTAIVENNLERASFAGGIIRNIGKGTAMFNLFEGARRRLSVYERRQSLAQSSRRSELMTLNDEDLRKLKQVSAFERRQSVAVAQKKSTLPDLDDENIKKLRRMSVVDRQGAPANRRQSIFDRRQSIFDPGNQRKSVTASGLTEEQLKKLRRISTFDSRPDEDADREDMQSDSKPGISSGYDAETDDLARTSSRLMQRPIGRPKPDEMANERVIAKQKQEDEDYSSSDSAKMTTFPPIKRRESSEAQVEKKESYVIETPFAFTPSRQKHKDEDKALPEIVKETGQSGRPPPDEMNRTPSKLMRRPTGFIRPDEVKKILQAQNRDDEDDDDDDDNKDDGDSEDDDEDEPPEISPGKTDKKRGLSFAATSQTMPDDMNRTPSKLMRRPTAYIRADEVKKILQAQNRYDEGEEDEDVAPNAPTSPADSEDASKSSLIPADYMKKRRQTATFAQELTEVKQFQREKQTSSPSSEESDEKSAAEKAEKGAIKLPIIIPQEAQKAEGEPEGKQTGYVRKSHEEVPFLENIEDEKKKTDDGAQEEGTISKRVSETKRISETKDKVDLAALTPKKLSETVPLKKGHLVRRSTAEDDSTLRESVIRRLYEDAMQIDDNMGPPTLKNYKPISERIPKNLLLSFGRRRFPKETKKDIKEDFMRPSLAMDESFEQVANVQYKVKSKISEDYIHRLYKMEQPREVSFRSMEYAHRRPTLSVAQYQQKNKQRQERIQQEERKERDKKLAEDPMLEQLFIRDASIHEAPSSR